MLIKTFYKPELTKGDTLKGNKNVLSFNTKDKVIDGNGYLQITEFGWDFIWLLIKNKLKGYRIFLLITPFLPDSEFREKVSIFKMSNKQIKENLKK